MNTRGPALVMRSAFLFWLMLVGAAIAEWTMPWSGARQEPVPTGGVPPHHQAPGRDAQGQSTTNAIIVWRA